MTWCGDVSLLDKEKLSHETQTIMIIQRLWESITCASTGEWGNADTYMGAKPMNIHNRSRLCTTACKYCCAQNQQNQELIEGTPLHSLLIYSSTFINININPNFKLKNKIMNNSYCFSGEMLSILTILTAISKWIHRTIPFTQSHIHTHTAYKTEPELNYLSTDLQSLLQYYFISCV
jgi:hypothetical protein